MADLFGLDGKVAVVVGGGGGIGKPLALGLGRQGADLALASRDLEKLKGVAKEIEADPEVKGKVKAFRMDATDEDSVADAAKEDRQNHRRRTCSQMHDEPTGEVHDAHGIEPASAPDPMGNRRVDDQQPKAAK